MQDTKDRQMLQEIPEEVDDTYFYASYDEFIETYTTDLLGRRTQCSPEVAQELGQLMYAGLTVVDAAKAVGVTARSINNWINRGLAEVERLSRIKERGVEPEFKLGEEQYVYFYEIYSRAVALKKLKLLKNIESKGSADWRSDIWQLERMFPDEFGRKTKVEIIDWRTEAIQLIKDGIFSYQDILRNVNNDAEEAQGLFKSAGVPIITARAIEEDSNES